MSLLHWKGSRFLNAWGEGAHFSHKEVNNMKLPKNLGMLLLGIWLIVTGLLQVFSIHIPAVGTILALLAIAAGFLILFGR
jgi:hypothetical protein